MNQKLARFGFFVVLFLSLAAGSLAQTVAITIDDGPNTEQTPLMFAAQRNQAMLDALKRHQVSAALFVTAGYGANRPDGLALTKAWGEAGHQIANHTMTHPNLESEKVSVAQYQQEILQCDAIISQLPGYQRWFRYTYLREGDSPKTIASMQKFLKAQNYRNAYVSLDTSDWRLNDALIQVLKKNPNADLTPIKSAYLAHVKQRALAYRSISQQLQGRDIAQVLLLHHNLINALWLGDVIEQFKSMGWTIVSPQVAFEDPVYQLTPQSRFSGQSLLLSIARSLMVGRVAGFERLTDDGDFEIEQLNTLGLKVK